jgi:hypothetical protein
MQMRRFTQLPGLTLAVLLTLLVGSVGADDSKLKGTWNVDLQFGRCDATCPCPPNVTTDTSIPGLHMYLKDGSLLEVGGGSPLRGPGLGSWESVGKHQFVARFKFFLFNSNGSPRGSEEVTNHIHLTVPDAFEATGTFDLFDATGNRTSPEEGCPINATATRFE